MPNFLVLGDVLAMLAFITLCVNSWPGHVHVSMMQVGILRAYIPVDLILGGDFLPRTLMVPSRIILYVYFYLPLLMFACQSWRKQTISQGEMIFNLLFTRFIMGSGIFLMLAIACLSKTIILS